MRNRLLLYLLPFLLLAIQSCRPERADPDAEWIQLFNGSDLAGWTAKISGYGVGENFGDTFRVVDRKIQVAYDNYESFDDRFGHLFYETPFSNYQLRVEYRFIGEQLADGPGWAWRNSGIMVHGQSPETMGRDQDFPVSIEVQLLGGRDTGERSTANLCTPGTHVVMDDDLVTTHCIDSASATYRGDQWVAVEVEVRGGEVITHSIDGESVLSYNQPQLDSTDVDAQALLADVPTMLTGGTISLQSESHPVEFRKVELRVLDE